MQRQDSNIVASLKYMSELNKLRQTKRTALTAQQIIKAQNVDNGANMQSGQVAEDTADGSPVDELNVNWDLMSWAQRRADALAERAAVNQSQPISHDNMYVALHHGLPRRSIILRKARIIRAAHTGSAPRRYSSDIRKPGKAATTPSNPGIASYPLLLAIAGRDTAITSPK